MISTTYYNVDQKVFNSPEGRGVWGWKAGANHLATPSREQAEELKEKQMASFLRYVAREQERVGEDDAEVNDHLSNLLVKSDWRITSEVKNYTHASEFGYSDVHAYEIVKVISDKTLEVRRMDAEFDISHLNTVAGGFSGHVENQRGQKVTYASNPDAAVIRIRRSRKDHDLWVSKGRQFLLQTEPYAFHDYNF